MLDLLRRYADGVCGLARETGYSENYLYRVASGRAPRVREPYQLCLRIADVMTSQGCDMTAERLMRAWRKARRGKTNA